MGADEELRELADCYADLARHAQALARHMSAAAEIHRQLALEYGKLAEIARRQRLS